MAQGRRGWGRYGWVLLSVDLDASFTGFQSLAFGRDRTAPRDRPLSVLAHGSPAHEGAEK